MLPVICHNYLYRLLTGMGCQTLLIFSAQRLTVNCHRWGHNGADVWQYSSYFLLAKVDWQAYLLYCM